MAVILSAEYDKAAKFKLSDPRSWPSLYLLTTLFLTLCPTLCLTCESPFMVIMSMCSLLMAILVKSQVLLNDRRENHKIFDRGNVPSVGNKNVISGNLFEMIVPKQNMKVIDEYHKKLGKTFGIFYGPDPWIFTCDLDLLHKLLIKDKLPDRVQFQTPFSKEFHDSLAQINGEKWRKTRRVLNVPFTSHQMRSDNVDGDIDLVLDIFMKSIEKHSIENSERIANEVEDKGESRIVDLNCIFKKLTVEVISRVAFGRNNLVNWEPDGREQVIDAVDKCSVMVRNPIVWASIMFDGSRQYLDHLVNLTPMRKFLKLLHGILDDSFKSRRSLNESKRQVAKVAAELHEAPVADEPRKMIDSMIDLVDEKKLTDSELRSNLFFMFLAGFETTANTLTVLFWLLAEHQKIQDKLREAVAREADKAQYLDWCIKETLRLYPAVPTGIGRIIPETFHYKDYTIYKGTSVVAPQYTINRLPEYWGDDALDFRPERLGEMTNLHPIQLMPFGHGPRRCLGGHLAMAEISAAVPRVLLKYRIERCSTTPDELDITSPNLIHMIIHGRVEVRFRELNAQL